MLIGCLLPGANAILFFAERHVPTGLAALIFASVPLWLAAMRLTRERLPWQMLAGVGLGFAGVAVLAQPSGGVDGWGVALVLLAALMWATGSYLSSRIPMPDDPFAATSLEMLAGGLVMLPFSLLTVHGLSPSAASIAGWAYLVTFGSLLGFSAYIYLLHHVRPALATSYAYVNPPVAVLFGVMFAGESVRLLDLAGMAVILTGVAAITLAKAKKT